MGMGGVWGDAIACWRGADFMRGWPGGRLRALVAEAEAGSLPTSVLNEAVFITIMVGRDAAPRPPPRWRGADAARPRPIRISTTAHPRSTRAGCRGRLTPASLQWLLLISPEALKQLSPTHRPPQIRHRSPLEQPSAGIRDRTPARISAAAACGAPPPPPAPARCTRRAAPRDRRRTSTRRQRWARPRCGGSPRPPSAPPGAAAGVAARLRS
eukprot:gene1896-biopygen9503